MGDLFRGCWEGVVGCVVDGVGEVDSCCGEFLFRVGGGPGVCVSEDEQERVEGRLPVRKT